MSGTGTDCVPPTTTNELSSKDLESPAVKNWVRLRVPLFSRLVASVPQLTNTFCPPRSDKDTSEKLLKPGWTLGKALRVGVYCTLKVRLPDSLAKIFPTRMAPLVLPTWRIDGSDTLPFPGSARLAEAERTAEVAVETAIPY
jgi:hypothetical protein